MALGEALGGLVGGILGNNAAKMDRRHQKKLMKQMVEEYKKIGYPPDYAREIIMQELVRQGQYTPELEEDLSDSVAESAMGDIQEDPALREAQMGALSSMQQRGKVGLSAEDRAALNQVRSEVQRDSEAKRQQILQQMQSRGMGGSGAELMMQLQSAQGAADQAAAGSDTLMAQAQARAMEAIKNSAGMAGQVREQDFGVAGDKARAIDERNRFLAENTISRQQRNVQNLNQAQVANLQEQQRIADYNTQLKNTELLRQREAEQAQYTDKLNYAAGITGQQKQLAQYHGNTADAKAKAQVDMAKGVGAGVDSGYNAMTGAGGDGGAGGGGGGGGGMAGMASMAAMFSDKNLKNNIEYSDEDVQKWMDSLSERIIKKKI